MERMYVTLLGNTFLMDVEKSFLRATRGDKVEVNEVSWLRKEDFSGE